MTTSMVDLDSFTCGSDPIEAVMYLKNNNVLFVISLNNPYYNEITKLFTIEIKKKEGDRIYFRTING
ncbi:MULTISPECIES: hypothetical protein [Acidianus]|uniref:Uncharacterized protein n=1 Tax=Candidatus Acidianus copahuensis TaxID=1160895 RepID=A0A031LR10_9CREN|nr:MULTISPECIES: hypothetical protein [Acidianus]EZQ10822.1 hypothetical protein CM19_03025 [Candidatus Acidianus copahuensis]NON62859.1 hypothetical protein [Acidianus sp. RZ1]